MDAAVPFALVAAVQLLALAAALGLAAAGGALAYRRSARVLLVTGALLLATAHGFTGALLGRSDGDPYAYLRAVGYLLVALGAGGLATAPVLAAGVLVPMGATPPAAGAAAVAAGLAAALSRRVSRPGAALLSASLGLSVAAEALGPASRTHTWAAVTLLVLRGVAALAVLGFVVRLVESSLLGKVVAAILAAVLGLALGTALLVGSVATDSLKRDSNTRLTDVASGQVEILKDLKQTSLSLARVLAECRGAAIAVCQAQLSATTSDLPVVGYFCGLTPTACKDRPGQFRNLDDEVAIRYLRNSGAVQEVMRSTETRRVATIDVVLGKTPMLLAIGVAPGFQSPPTSPRRPDIVAVYAIRIDANRVDAIANATGLQATLYIGDHRIAPVANSPERTVLDGELRRRHVLDRLRAQALEPADDGVSLGADGARPGVRYQPIRSENGSLAGVLAISAESNVILATQRQVLSALFLGTVAIALLVGVFAVALGRRIVRPVTELTLAASRIRRGDLDVRTSVDATDELGVLSRTFDAMTSSLAASNESLRRAAADEAALRARLATILESIGDGIVTTDAKDRVVGVNGAALDLLGAPEDAVVGRPLADVLAGSTTSGEPLLDLLDGAAAGRVGRLDRPDGSSVPVALATTPLRGERGHVVVVRDTTREHEVERMKTEFLSNVSHELRTPLTPIRGYAEILQRRPDLPAEKTSEYAASILDSSVRMSRVVDLLVDVASLEAGRVVPRREPVKVGTFVSGRVTAWRKREPKRDFRRRVATGLPDVLVDPDWVAKAYDELVDNAVKYSAGPVTLAASFAADGRHVLLTVRDGGPGIPEDRRASLFTSFEQIDGSATRAIGGLGLGLSFVRRVADDFGLDVVVESTVGKGSAFSLVVPVAPVASGPRKGRR